MATNDHKTRKADCYAIYWVGWNAAHPFRTYLGQVHAYSIEDARTEGRRKWPCGNGQIYEAVLETHDEQGGTTGAPCNAR